jgi:hypothetical protein
MTRGISWVALVLAVAACDADPYSPEHDPRFVVQAYLYAGEPVDSVRITGTLPLGATGSTAPPINDADVVLIRRGNSYALVPMPGGDGYYHYPGTDLSVTAGDVFQLVVTARGVTATAQTVVPAPPGGLELAPTSLRVDGYWAVEPVVVRWPNPERAWYFITHRNVEADPEPIFDGTIVLRPGLIVSEPTAADSAVISVFSMRHYGRYDVTLYRVNEEYVQLYMSLEQDTRDLNEPVTNIANGFGIFTAFNGRDGSFTLSR